MAAPGWQRSFGSSRAHAAYRYQSYSHISSVGLSVHKGQPSLKQMMRFSVAASNHIRSVMSELQRLEKPYRRIMIVGGGNIGASLAKRLEQSYSVKLIERSYIRAEKLSEELENTIVFCGDAVDQELLLEENIDQVDVFIALTNEDETNIMSAMLAKRMGAKKGHGFNPARSLCRSRSRWGYRCCHLTTASHYFRFVNPCSPSRYC